MKYKAVFSRCTTVPRAFVGSDGISLLSIRDKATLPGGGKMPLPSAYRSGRVLSVHSYFPVVISSSPTLSGASLIFVTNTSRVSSGAAMGLGRTCGFMLYLVSNTSVRRQSFTAFLYEHSKSHGENIIPSSSSCYRCSCFQS